MKHIRQTLYTLLAVMAFTSCNSSNTPTPVTPGGTNYYNLPNWDSVMLYGQIVQTNTTPAGADSMLSYTKNGVAYIRYEGVEYTLKAFDKNTSPPTPQNNYAYFVDIFLNNQLVNTGIAQPHKYTQNGQWVTTWQTLTLDTQKPPFNNYVINGGGYTSFK